MTRNGAAIVIVMATVLGGAARLSSADWGLPFAFHVDERKFVLEEAMATEWRGLRRNDFRPNITTYGPVLYEAAIATKWMFEGGVERAAEIAARYTSESHYLDGAFGHDGERPFRWPVLLHRLRILSALLGSAVIVLLGCAALRLEGPSAAAMTAIATAACVGLIQVSHFYTAEAWLVFAVALVLHALSGLASGGGTRWAVYAGAGLALAAASKPPGVLVGAAVPVALAARAGATSWADWWRLSWKSSTSREFLVTAASTLFVLAILNPWLVFQPWDYFASSQGARSGWKVLGTHLQQGGFDFYDWRFTYNDTTPLGYHLTVLLPYALGGGVLAGAAAGLLWGLRRRTKLGLIAAAAALPSLLFVAPWGVKSIRFVLPVLPPLLILSGSALAAAWTLAPSRGWARIGLRTLATGILLHGVAYGSAFTAMFREEDPRIRAARFIGEQARAGDVVVVEPDASYTAPLGTNDENVGVHAEIRPPVEIRRLWGNRPPDGRVKRHLESTLGSARFLVVGEWYRRRGLHPSAHVRAPAQHVFYRALVAEETGYERVASFRPMPRLGPLVFDESGAEVLSVCFDHMPIEVYERVGPFRNPLDRPYRSPTQSSSDTRKR